MSFLSALTFTTPLALGGLLLLPVIWWLLRISPPRPETVKFPPLRLLLDLVNREEQPDKTPWWLLLLRLLVAALVILGVSHPLYAPGRVAALSSDPLLLVVDDSWAAASDWARRQQVMAEILEGARRAGAVVTLAVSTPQLRPQALEPVDVVAARARAAALQPRAAEPDRDGLLAALREAFGQAPALRVIWLSDGLDDGKAAGFARGLSELAGGRAGVEVIVPHPDALPTALAAPAFEAGRIMVTALRAASPEARTVRVVARAGNGRNLADIDLAFAANAARTSGSIDIPVELRNEIARIEIAGEHHAGATFLMDDRWRRKTVALLSGTASEATQPLLSPLYYVSRALEPYAALREPADAASLKMMLDQGLSLLVLADIGVLPPDIREMVADWVSRGGVLLRFAGPRLAGAHDDLVPVRLREGGRSLGSALSWETPQPLQAFADQSPLAGLAIDQSVRVARQVLAEPDADLPDRVWASLADGTPLVTARTSGRGLIILFHVTANADWSNLPLTGLFVEMLRRVLDLAPAAGGGSSASAAADGQAFVPWRALTGFGELAEPAPEIQPIPASAIDRAVVSPATPAGLYRRGGQERALNLEHRGDGLVPLSALPASVSSRALEPLPARPLAPYLFAAAMLLFLLDGIAALVLGGGLGRLRARTGLAALLLAMLVPFAEGAHAQGSDDSFALKAALRTRLAYVITGNSSVDQVSLEGLTGLNAVLRERTSVDPGEPMGVDIERDELAFFPLIYWPVTPDAPTPSDAALGRIDFYMKNGGTILFDLRDDGLDASQLAGGSSPSGEALRRMLARLDIPPLETVPEDHVLTRSFYLLDRFPGRYANGRLWVERSSEAGTAGSSDGVSSIIIGSNDYAAAWAMDQDGGPLYAVIPGSDRQREFALRTGVNIVMYALTGNYKADQVHVPALLERLGQ